MQSGEKPCKTCFNTFESSAFNRTQPPFLSISNDLQITIKHQLENTPANHDCENKRPNKTLWKARLQSNQCSVSLSSSECVILCAYFRRRQGKMDRPEDYPDLRREEPHEGTCRRGGMCRAAKIKHHFQNSRSLISPSAPACECLPAPPAASNSCHTRSLINFLTWGFPSQVFIINPFTRTEIIREHYNSVATIKCAWDTVRHVPDVAVVYIAGVALDTPGPSPP